MVKIFHGKSFFMRQIIEKWNNCEKKEENCTVYWKQATDDDGKGQTTSVSLRVSLGDANDSPPRFLQETYRAVVDEGAEKFEPELKVQARDKDKTSKISYSIPDGNELGFFAIDTNSGEISIVKRGPVDVTNSSQDWIALTVQASDGKFIDSAIVNITIRDVNNNAPVFPQDVYTASVPEISTLGESNIFP